MGNPYYEQLAWFMMKLGSTLCLSVVKCPALSKIKNGNVTCSFGDDKVLSYEDTCSITCDTGYTLTGSASRMCQSDGSWGGIDGVCDRGNLFNRTS